VSTLVQGEYSALRADVPAVRADRRGLVFYSALTVDANAAACLHRRLTPAQRDLE
jgi:hypothetical protein